MSEEELFKFLKDNLEIEISGGGGMCTNTIDVAITLMDQEISSDSYDISWLTMPDC